MDDFLKTYFEELKKFNVREGTEHSLRPAVDNLLKAFSATQKPPLEVLHEPRHDKEGHGAPDFKVKRNEALIGYVECKKVGHNLLDALKTEQIKKYTRLKNNLLLTDYLTWLWVRDNRVSLEVRFAKLDDVGNRKARLDAEGAEALKKLLLDFTSVTPTGIGKAKVLAEELAVRCHDLRDFLAKELGRQKKEGQQQELFGLYNALKENISPALTLEEFADAFSQMLGYGLFMAKLNANSQQVTLKNAEDLIPGSFGLIKELVQFLKHLEKRQYVDIKWVIEEILSIMNTLDLASLHQDLTFRKTLYWEEDEERLFAKDPFVYFYEDFLKAYDAKMRKSRGVYYTPPPVVHFIIRAVNDILKKDFGIREGLADNKRVTLLDFAAGTGTFLVEVLHQIFEGIDESQTGLRNAIVREHVLKNLYGFEYLIAPYTIAHLKLSQFLKDKGYSLRDQERLQIYLTNTLEPVEPQLNWLLPALSEEGAKAHEVKEKPILVITGNPPYSGSSKNKGAWITDLIETYKYVDGQHFGERKHWLQDDYVKFIRFAQWKMDQVEKGIVGIISNHSWIDNPTFRGMRQALMKTFNRIYILDLHGNTKKKEKTPSGGKDENVFDIEQGVAISLFIKNPRLTDRVFHSDFWGKRRDKYRLCLSQTLNDTKWSTLKPSTPNYYLTPFKKTGLETYSRGLKIDEIFSKFIAGIVTARDKFSIDIDRKKLESRLSKFKDERIPDKEIRAEYRLRDTRGWKVESARKEMCQIKDFEANIKQLDYCPFDQRWIFYHPSAVDWGRWKFLPNMIAGNNFGLCLPKRVEIKRGWEHALVTNKLMQHHTVSMKEVNYLFPLFLYFEGRKEENFSKEFRKFIDEKYGHKYKPEEILGYVYAVLHSPTYREKYKEFLKSNFPRIPFVDDRKTFEKLSKLGWELVQTHLLDSVPKSRLGAFKGKGENQIDAPRWSEKERRLYINKNQYFEPVPEDVWEFTIGGYPVLDKYLKARREKEVGRPLTLDEIKHVANVINVLAFTIEQMNKIDKVW